MTATFKLSTKAIEDLEFTLGPRSRRGRGDVAGAERASRDYWRFTMSVASAPAKGLVSIFGQGTHDQKSRQAVAALKRTVSRSPEVMVKVTGRQNGAGHVLANFTYISREGWGDELEVDILTDRGEVIRTHEEKEQLAARWQRWEEADDARRKGATSVSLVLSMPAGTDAARVLSAARNFAGDEMQNRSWAMALHTDTDSPHVHLTVARRGHDGQRFHPGREDLFRYRLAFAEKLRDEGIDANATPRKARGVTKKSGKTAIVQIERRGETSRYVKRLRAEALDALRSRSIVAGPFDSEIAEQQRAVINGFKVAALELSGAPDKESRALAGKIVTHMKSMPMIETKAAENVRVLRDALRGRQAEDRQASDRGGNGGKDR